MSIYITGDIHGNPVRLSTDSFYEQKEMTKDDYVIILGDFGLVWNCKGESKNEKWWLNWLEDKPFTTLFIDGNHENHDRLDEYPVEEWHGGKVHKIRPSVIHLMRGQVYEIEGKKFFTFGGAASHDIKDGILDVVDDAALIKKWRDDYTKLFRINKVSWWDRELPSEEEMDEELRLMYVATTRAKNNLYITYPVDMYDYSMNMVLSKPSRFLNGISDEILEVWDITEE